MSQGPAFHGSDVDFGARQFQKTQFGHRPSDERRADYLETAKKKVQLPSTLMQAVSALSLVALVGGAIWTGQRLAENWQAERSSWSAYFDHQAAQQRFDRQGVTRQRDRHMASIDTNYTIQYAVLVVGTLVMMTVMTFILVASSKMKLLKSYRMVFVAAILCVIPGVSPLGVLGIPIGIWSLIVLNQPDVKKAFRVR